jgi:hypothetical protein
MSLIECPGCFSRMVNGVCSMCGYADPHHTATAVDMQDMIDRLGSELLQPVATAWDSGEESKVTVPIAPQQTIEPVLNVALINCPVCSNGVSETAANCPKCGFELTSEFVATEKQKGTPVEEFADSPPVAIAVFGFMLLVGLFWSWVIGDSASSINSTSSQS